MNQKHWKIQSTHSVNSDSDSLSTTAISLKFNQV